jgi:hypothetical protein
VIGMFERACLRLSLLAALSLVVPSGRAHAVGETHESLAAPYALQASQQTIADVLDRFAADHGLTVRVGGDASAGWKTAKLDGWVRAPSGREFLEQLAHAHRFSWFIAERTLHLSGARDSAVERIGLGGIRADSARAALEAVGIYDARFGWGELSGQDAVLVGGPRAYRALMRRFLASRAHAGDGQADPEPMIFPLRFAKAADDPPSDARGSARPGVAALMRQLLVQEAPAAQVTFALPPQPEPLAPLPSAQTPLAQWLGVPGLSAAPSPALPTSSRLRAARSAAADAGQPSVVADERTNSVIVWADRRWRSRLQQLVDALDRPSSLVSIDVLVIEGEVATVAALSAASERAHAGTVSHPSTLDDPIAEAIAARRVRVLNRQMLVGEMNAHTTLAIGGEASHPAAAPNEASAHASGETLNGRSGHEGDRLDLAARIVPSNTTAATLIAVDVDLLMAQPTGLPGQLWTNTSSVKLDTAVTLESGAPPRLIASYPVATARAEQRAIFISAKAL